MPFAIMVAAMSFLFEGFSSTAKKEFADAAGDLRTFLQRECIRLSPSSRLARYIDAVSSHGQAPATLGATQVLHRALLEIDDLRLIAQYLPAIPCREDWRVNFQRLIKGAVLPTGDSNTSARDCQFEFLTAAMLGRAGCEVRLAEPDIIVKSPRSFVIAAKRLVSSKQLASQCQRGARQIRKSRIDGIIAVDVTTMIYEPEVVVRAQSFLSAHFQMSETVAQCLRLEASNIRRLVDPQKIIGLAFYAAALVREDVGGDAGYVRGWTFANLCESDDPRWTDIGHVAERMNVASFLRVG